MELSRLIQAVLRAVYLMLTPQVWLLIAKPMLFSLFFWLCAWFLAYYVWGSALWQSKAQFMAWFDAQFVDLDYRVLTGLSWALGLMALVVVSVLFIVLVVIWAMLLISVFGMSRINHLVARRYFPDLAANGGVTLRHSVVHTLKWTLWFAVFWMLSVPAYVLAGLGALMQGAVIARFNQKVFTLDALADHASADEYAVIGAKYRWHLFALGALVTLLGAFPTFVWVGSVVGALFLPFTAMLSVLMFTALFAFCGLLYSCYCLQALYDLRAINVDGILSNRVSPPALERQP